MKNKIVYIILICIVCIITFIGIKDLTPRGKERRYKEKMEYINEAAVKYGESIEDRLSSHCFEVSIQTLVNSKLIKPDRKGLVINPITNERMNNKRICITKENDKIFSYEKKRK